MMTRSCAALGAFCMAFGCAGAPPAPETPEPAAAAAAAATPAAGTSAGPEDQVALGAKLYGQHCAGCHGANGQGTSGAPPVVGKGALPLDAPPGAKFRTVKFKTALDVAQFVVKSMPPKAVGSLKEEEYWAILAFDLKANGVDLGGKKVGPDNAASFVLHP
jgi:mono/diheme cytochrome c family protein